MDKTSNLGRKNDQDKTNFEKKKECSVDEKKIKKKEEQTQTKEKKMQNNKVLNAKLHTQTHNNKKNVLKPENRFTNRRSNLRLE